EMEIQDSVLRGLGVYGSQAGQELQKQTQQETKQTNNTEPRTQKQRRSKTTSRRNGKSKKTRGPNEPVPEIPQQHFLKVAPLNPEGVPYVGPPLDQSNTPSTPSGVVALTGSSAMRPARPTLGLVDIGESEDSYLFRVSIPGVAVLESKFH
ncbi:hypothetical protein Dsin_023733, partial [Dipteronia sinensis]